ncbi:hypothetical protein L2D14_15840 [Thalassospiraceae bacterium LMO-JJ14]|nr:hypothetical protein L2D14_15840 [Thalassospiraceae bacterium LMO-JJ14]
MNKSKLKSWLIAYLRQPFNMIVWVMETFAKNRKRLAVFLAREKVASVFKAVVVATFFVWLGVFAFLSSSEEGDRFTCALKSLWPDADMTGCETQPWLKPAKTD